MQELDLRSIFYLLLARVKWIILAVVAGAVLLGAYAMLVMPEKYTSTAMLYMTNLNDSSNTSAATTSNLSAAERLVKTVQTATTAPWALQSASDKLGGRLTKGQLASCLNFSAVTDTSFLKLSVTYTDPELTQQACDVLAQTAADAFAATGESGKASVYQTAVAATKTSPNIPRMTVLGAAAGFLLSVTLILLTSLFNTTVHGREDIQNRLNVPVLGEIPSFELVAKGGAKKHG